MYDKLAHHNERSVGGWRDVWLMCLEKANYSYLLPQYFRRASLLATGANV